MDKELSNYPSCPDIKTAEASLREEFMRAFPPFLIYLATIIILVSFVKDVVKIGFNTSWLLIRACYLPFILIVWHVSKQKLSDTKKYEVPLWAAALYITVLCSYFSFATGGVKK